MFAESLIAEARKDDKIVAITAAMPDGTGLDLFGKEFPDRTFDVGIAEQHAVTFAGGLATEGLKPFAAIYSTFLQRAYDQVVHDIAIQRLPVRFAIDRAGLVGADGPTHAGSFDFAYLGCLPGFVIMAPADEAELKHMVATAAAIDDRPIRRALSARGRHRRRHAAGGRSAAEIGKGRILREGSAVALLSLGTRAAECLKAADQLAAFGLSTTVADARFAKPLDEDLIRRLAAEPRGAGHGGGRLDRRLRQPRAAVPRRRAACSTAASRCAPWCCPIPSSIRTSPSACTSSPACRPRHRRDRAGGARPRDADGRGQPRLVVRGR